MLQVTRPWAHARPVARTIKPLPVRELLRCAATSARLRAIEADWLWPGLSAEGQRRLLREHGLT